MLIEYAKFSDPNAARHSLLCMRCGGELYSGEILIFWDNLICAECMRDKIRLMSDVRLAQLIGCKHFTVK